MSTFALLMGLGGGFIRDMLLGNLPAENALALGLFAVTGTAYGFTFGLPVVSAVLVGVISAVGGGVLVSVLQNHIPGILVASTPNALRRPASCSSGSPVRPADPAGRPDALTLLGCLCEDLGSRS